jgi:hypothetical protein
MSFLENTLVLSIQICRKISLIIGNSSNNLQI